MRQQGFAPLVALIGIAVLLATGGAVYYARTQNRISPTPSPITTMPTDDPNGTTSITIDPLAPTEAPTGEDITAQGQMVCLPHKQQGDVQTMECAYGIKTSDGSFYSLYLNEKDMLSVNTGDTVKVTGKFTPTPSSIYVDKGRIYVLSYEVVKKAPISDPLPM